jgi:hypothetical protein
LASSAAHLIHRHGQGPLVRANHASERTAAAEAFFGEPSARPQGAKGDTTDGLVKLGQAAGGYGTQFFYGQVSGGQWRKGGHFVHQHHHRLAGLVFNGSDGVIHGNDRCNGGGDGLRCAAQYKPPVPGDQCPNQQQAGQDHADATVHDGSPFPRCTACPFNPIGLIRNLAVMNI